MSADNYWFVRKRPDGQYGISHRFASSYYEDEHTLADVEENGGDSSWLDPAPEDKETYATAEEAIMAAHRFEFEEWTEYGVGLGAGVLPEAE